MTQAISKVFISCGEYSGEQHACRVVEELYKLNPAIKIYAFGSSALAQLGVELVCDYRDYSFSGVTEVLRNLSKISELQNRIIQSITELEPDLVLLVDYGAFNLKIAKALSKQHGHKPLIYEFIAPQIWASRPWRINKIKKYVDKVLCTLPFEEDLYKQANIRCRYVGNPVATSLASSTSKEDFASRDEILIGVFPGSRKSEIKYMLPLMREAAITLTRQNPKLKFKFILAKAANLDISVLERCGLNQYPKIFEVIDGSKSNNHKLLSASDILWLCSGTVTLEAALYGTPHFLSYKSNLINYMFYLVFRITKQAGLANIINGSELAKEFLQYQANISNFINETESFLYEDPSTKIYTGSFSSYYHKRQKALRDFRSSLSGLDTARIVAEEIINAHTLLQ